MIPPPDINAALDLGLTEDEKAMRRFEMDHYITPERKWELT